MKTKIAILFCIMAVLPGFGQSVSKIIDLRTGEPTEKRVSTRPEIKVKESGDTLTVSLEFRYAQLTTSIGSDKCSIDIEGFGRNSVPGEPEWLLRNFNYPVENGCNLFAEMTDYEFIELPVKLSTASEPKPDIASEAIPTISESLSHKTTQKNIFVPECVVTTSDPQYYRGRGFVQLQVSPVQYNAVTSTARIARTLTYRVIIGTGPKREAPHIGNPFQLDTAHDDDFYMSLMPTHLRDSRLGARIMSKANGQVMPAGEQYGYLILTVDGMKSAAERLAAWKKMLGFNTTIVSKSGSGTSVWTPDEIKRIIKLRASNNRMLYYVLIIGDNRRVPAVKYNHIDNRSSYFMSDFQYSCLDGDDDIIPDLYIGRIPATLAQQAMNAVNKIIEYEKNPPLNNNYYQRPFFFAEFDGQETNPQWEYSPFVYSAETIRKGLANITGMRPQKYYVCDAGISPSKWNTDFANGASIPEELRKPNYNWQVDADDIVSAINTGAVFGLYRGHGSPYAWGYTFQNLQTDILQYLNNAGRYPVIFSMTCQNGCYDRSSNCVANQFLHAKSAGAAGVIAATEISYSPLNDILSGALINCFYPNSDTSLFPLNLNKTNFDAGETTLAILRNNRNYSLGKALAAAKQVLAQCYPQKDPYSLITLRLFHCFGDPSMEMKTKVPITNPDVRIIPLSNGFDIVGISSSYTNPVYVTVVDTVSSRLISHQLLTTCTIAASTPKNCKVTVSGYDIRPLIIDGAEGYTSWNKLKCQAEEDEEYDEYQFCEYVSNIDGKRGIHNFWMDLLNFAWEKISTNSRETIYDVNLYGCNVVKSDINPGCESYTLETVGFKPSEERGRPGLNWEKIGYPNEFDDSYSCEVIGGTYVELPDIDVIPSGRYTPKSTYHMTDGEFEAIKPYSGWWPEMKDMVDKIQYERLILCPYQYNYETRTVRLYSSLRLKFNKKTSVETIDNEDARPVYYTIDGRIEPEPANGKMYIRRNSDRAEKVIYKR